MLEELRESIEAGTTFETTEETMERSTIYTVSIDLERQERINGYLLFSGSSSNFGS